MTSPLQVRNIPAAGTPCRFDLLICPSSTDLWAMKEGMTNEYNKEWAKLLYTRHDATLKEIALKTGAEEAQIRQWIQEGGWDGMKRSLLTSKEELLHHIYDMLGKLTGKMKEQEEGNTKDADLLIKYTAAIKNLEAETSVTQIIEVAQQFINWLQVSDMALAKTTALRFDRFIKERLDPVK